MIHRWYVTSDWKSGEHFGGLNNKTEALDRICNEFVYLQRSVISRIEVIRGNYQILTLTKSCPNVPCDKAFNIVCNGKRFMLQECRTGYYLTEENERGIVSVSIGIYSSLRKVINYLITEHKEKNV